MPKFTNFFETVKEAELRLLKTVVMYDGEPYYVICISDHKGDGIFRIYLDKIGFHENGLAVQRISGIPYEWYQETPTGPTKGDKMDEWLNHNPNSGIIRKMMNSPAFNCFRPFPLGMCNIDGRVVYIERAPTRHTQQGLTQSMMNQSEVHLVSSGAGKGRYIGLTDLRLYDVIMGIYPSPEEILENLRNPEIANEGVAFHRNFAILRGPCDTMFLAYKDSVIGTMPNCDFTLLRLDRKFQYTKEIVEALQLFSNIQV